MIVPTGSVGLSGLTRVHPKIIMIRWPDAKVDERLKGTVSESLNKESVTYYDALKKALDEQLVAFGKETVGCSSWAQAERHMNEDDTWLICEATLSHNIKEGMKFDSQKGM